MSLLIIYKQTYINRFCNRDDVYAVQKVSGSKYWYEPVHEPIIIEVLDAHLTGHITLGFYVLNLESKSKWVCIDFDYEGDDMKQLRELFHRHGWRCLAEGKRPGRDGHLWLFFDEPISAIHLRRFAHVFVQAAGIPINKVEVFPKQDQLKDERSVGNLVRAPLGIHRKPGASMQRGWFVGAEEDVLAQLEWFQAQQPNRAADILTMAEQLEERYIISKAEKRTSPVARSKSALSRHSSPRVDWIDYARRNGFQFSNGFWSGPCPACKAIGHDLDSDHLSISSSGRVNCWRGCSFEEIIAAVHLIGR